MFSNRKTFLAKKIIQKRPAFILYYTDKVCAGMANIIYDKVGIYNLLIV